MSSSRAGGSPTDQPPWPPVDHLGRELQISYRLPTADRVEVTVPVVDALLDADGTVQREVLTTLLDEATGYVAVRAALPDWGSTAALSLRFLRTAVAPRGRLSVVGRVAKAGSRLVFVDAEVRWCESDAEPGAEGDRGAVVARAGGEFAKVGRLAHNLAMDVPPPDPDEVYEMGLPDSSLPAPFRERLGLEVRDAEAGVIEAVLRDYVRNSSAILHGGVVGALAVAAAEAAAGERAVDAHVQYLSAGRVGPFGTTAVLLDAADPAAGTGPLWRTEVVDRGQDDPSAPAGGGRLMARATVTTAPTGAVGGPPVGSSAQRATR